MRFRAVLLCAAALLAASAAAAQPLRTFVASTGLDTNPCSRIAPCRNFTAAVAAVAAGGEVVVLDSAGYGPVSIAKSVSIVAPAGVYAGITASINDGIQIAALGATVVLRGLTFNNTGVADYGIDSAAVAALHVERCVINGFNTGGVYISGTASDVFVDDTLIRENNYGLYVEPSQTTRVAVNGCRFERNAAKAVAIMGSGAAVTATIHETVAANNGGHAFYAYYAQMNVKDCVSTANQSGVVAEHSIVSVSGTIVAGSPQYGFYNQSSTFRSYSNNQLVGNGTPTSGAITPVPLQ